MAEQDAGAALVPYRADDALGLAAGWVNLPADERRRRAAAAAAAHDLPSLLGLLDAWLTLFGRAGGTPSAYTRRNYRQGAQQLLEAWRQENLLRPRREAAALWLRALEIGDGQARLAPSTARLRLAAARALYAALRWAGATEADPFADLRPGRDPTAAWDKRKPYPPGEIDDLLAVAQGEDRVLILLGAHAGLRVAECLALRWEDVSLAGRELVVQRGKGGKKRIVPLSRSLAGALAALQRGASGYVLSVRTGEAARYRLRRLTRRHGLPYRGIHALRHACGTRLVRENGGDLETAAKLLGRGSIETTRAYVEWADEGLRRAVDGW
jgi:integrase/recombinase XerC